MQTSFKLALQIGATLGASFRGAVKGSQQQLNLLGASIDKLKAQQASLQKVELAEANVGKARVAYNAAANELMRLRKELTLMGPPTRKQLQAFDAAKQKTERLSEQLGRQKDRLQQARQELERSSAATNHLARDNVRLGASLDVLTQKYRKLAQAKEAQDNVKSQRAELRGQLFDAVALGATVAAPLKIAVDFEQSIARLGAITRASDSDLKALEATARKLGDSTVFSSSQAAEAMTYLGQAGFKTNQIIAASPGMLSLASAAQSDLAETADIASNILNGFSLKAAEMGRVGDVLAYTFTSSNTTLQMLGDTLKYAAPVASATGASLEEVAAMAGLLGNVGIQGSMAGTALRAAFLRLSAPPKEAADALKELGVEAADMEGNLRPVPELLAELAQAMEGMGSAQKAEALKHIFGEEAAAGMSELVKQASTGGLDKYIAELKKASGTADAMAKRMSATTRGAFDEFSSALESVAISFGNVLLPTLTSGARWLAGIASGVSRAAQAFPLLTTVVVGATVGLIALKIAAIAGAYAFTFVKGGVLTLVTAYRTLSAAVTLAQLGFARLNVLSALTAARTGIVTAAQWALNVAMTANPIGLIVAGIAALCAAAYLLIQYWEPLGGFFSGLWDGIKNMTSGAVDWLLDKLALLAKPFELLGQAWNAVGDFFSGNDDVVVPGTATATAGAGLAAPGAALATPTLAMPLATVDASPQIDAALPARKTEQTIQIDAPITIHTQPGMDEKAVAAEVQKALAQQQARAQSDKRSVLFDA